MKRISKQLLILIVIINFIGIIMEVAATCNCNVTRMNNLREEDRLETIKEKGVITVAGPPEETPFFYLNPERNAISGIDADIITEIARRLGINKLEINESTFANSLEKFNTDDSIDIAVGVEKGTIFEDLAKKWKENN